MRDIDELCDDGCHVSGYLKFVRLQSGYKRELLSVKYGVPRPIYRNTKHGTVCLSLPASLFIMDLTIYVDISRNPGPLEEFNYQQNLPSSSQSRSCMDAHISALTTNFHILVSRGGGWLGISLTIKF